jgi:high-affinity Fe2+/Pb2+ permease
MEYVIGFVVLLIIIGLFSSGSSDSSSNGSSSCPCKWEWQEEIEVLTGVHSKYRCRKCGGIQTHRSDGH